MRNIFLKLVIAEVLMAIATHTFADESDKYFTEGTRWIELRLDTTKFSGWYSENADGTFSPNYEQTEYYVHVDSLKGYSDIAKRYGVVWQHVEGQEDSVKFAIHEPSPNLVYSIVTKEQEENGKKIIRILGTARTYTFDWREGNVLTFGSMSDAGIASIPKYTYSFGTIGEGGLKVKSSCFGTGKPLSYIDVDTLHVYFFQKDYPENIGVKLIHGIGVTKWKSKYCILGPSFPDNMTYWASDPYLSILVHFERNGEVLYDLWPNEKGELVTRIPSVRKAGKDSTSIHDLQGRKVEGKLSRGIYIIGGKKRVVN